MRTLVHILLIAVMATHATGLAFAAHQQQHDGDQQHTHLSQTHSHSHGHSHTLPSDEHLPGAPPSSPDEPAAPGECELCLILSGIHWTAPVLENVALSFATAEQIAPADFSFNSSQAFDPTRARAPPIG
ncbi:MAG: DUF2946 family protein [Phycisphaeraceae bacterium]